MTCRHREIHLQRRVSHGIMRSLTPTPLQVALLAPQEAEEIGEQHTSIRVVTAFASLVRIATGHGVSTHPDTHTS